MTISSSLFDDNQEWQKLVEDSKIEQVEEIKEKKLKKDDIILMIEDEYKTKPRKFTANALKRETKASLQRHLNELKEDSKPVVKQDIKIETVKKERVEPSKKSSLFSDIKLKVKEKLNISPKPDFETGKSDIFKSTSFPKSEPIDEVESVSGSESEIEYDDNKYLRTRAEFLFALNRLSASGIEKICSTFSSIPFTVDGFSNVLIKDEETKERFIELWGDFYLEHRASIEPFVGTLNQILLMNMLVARECLKLKESK